MRRAAVALVLAVTVLFTPLAWAGDLPSDQPYETQRTATTRAVYFPFLALGHGILLIAKYGVAYPVWFLFKPVYDTLYSSSEDPEELSKAAEKATQSQ